MLCCCNPLVRDLDVIAVALDTDEAAPELFDGYPGTAASEEGIKNGVAFMTKLLDAPLHDRQRLLGRVHLLLAAVFDEAVPAAIEDHRAAVKAGPGQFAIGE